MISRLFIYRLFIYFGLFSLLTACSGPGYYLQAVAGQWKLNHARQDIQSLLSNSATSPELAAQLKLAEQLKAFANNELDLPANGSYSSYVEVDGDALLWNVVATREFSLQPKKWCFLVAGCVPYRGFFKYEKAAKSAASLEKKGLDVLVSPAAAYSSLGWFSDPLLSTMSGGSEARLAAYLFHELAHQRLYIKDDGLFNEGYASFVEEAGVRLWLESNQQQHELQKWQQLQIVQKDFSDLIGQIRKQLSSLYQSKIPETTMRVQKAGVFSSLSDSYEILVSQKWQGERYYSAWFKEPLNNAKLALYNTYEGSHCAFQQLWIETGGDMQQFHQLAEQKSRLNKPEREDWLKQTCPSLTAGIAPQANL